MGARSIYDLWLMLTVGLYVNDLVILRGMRD